MKRSFRIPCLLLVIALCSCNAEKLHNPPPDNWEFPTYEERVMSTPELRNDTNVMSELRSNKILLRYVKERGDSAVLDLTWEEAARLGVQQRWYDTMDKLVKEVSEALKKARREEAEMRMERGEPEGMLAPRVRTTSKWIYTGLRGGLRSLGQEAVYASEYAVRGTRGIVFSCFANVAPLASFTCKVRSSGTWRQESGLVSKIWPREFFVPLSTSDCMIGVAFHTTDPNGGVAAYNGVY